MNTTRKEMIRGHKVEEYYWHGEYVVYINNHLTQETFLGACKRLREELGDSTMLGGK